VLNRIAGEIALMSPQRPPAEGEAYFEWALPVTRQQQAKSRELRAAMSLAWLWRDQGSRSKLAILSPRSTGVHRQFDTLDLKEAKALLDALAS
jgi:hypothetical protein